MVRRLCLALPLGLMLLVGLSADQGHASAWDATLDDLQMERLDGAFEARRKQPGKGVGWPIYKRHPLAFVMSNELILAENLQTIAKFESSSNTEIPLMSVLLYMQTANQTGRKEPLLDDSGLEKAKPSIIPSFCLSLYRSGLDARQGGLLPKIRKKDQQDEWGLLSFLFKGDGLFSDRAWTEENFLPRVISLAVLLVLGLMIVEIMRLMFLMVLRVFHGPGHSR